MLAEALGETRNEVLTEMAHRADTSEGPGRPAIGRRERLSALLDELIDVLNRGVINDRPPARRATADPEIERNERELLRRYVLEKISDGELSASTAETALVSEWLCSIERNHLRERAQQLEVLLSSIEESTAVFAPDGHILYVNDKAAQALYEASGAPTDELVGRTLGELRLPEDWLLGGRVDLQALAHTRNWYETTLGGRAEQTKFETINAPDGTVVAVAAVSHSIQAQRVAENRLMLLSKLGRLVGTVDYDEVAEALAYVPTPELADWCAVNMIENKRIRRTFVAQRDPSKASIRDELTRVISTLDRHPLWPSLLTGGYQLLSEVTDEMVRQLALAQGHYRLLSQLEICSVMVMPVVARGQVAAIITAAYTSESGRRYGRDDPGLAEELTVHAAHIIETARLMRDLKASETRFRIALAGARTAVFEQDPTLRYRYYFNPATMFDPVGKTQEEAFPSEQAARLTGIKRHVLETGESAFEELDLNVGGEELRHYREAVEALRDHTGRIVGVIGAATDITEQQQARQQLTEMVVFRERMAGVLGHDLRNPLTTISMANGLLLGRTDLPPDARRQVERSKRAAERMQEMIETLLDVTRARFLGKIPISPVPADLDHIAEGVVDELRGAWPGRTLEVESHGDAHGSWDPGRMAQVISNLVVNAFTYGDPKTPVRVSVDGTGDHVVVRIHNEGPPIPPEIVPVLFEPFRRGAEDRSPRGLGLGLYIVQQLVQAHNGTITVASTTQGTTMTIDLPRSSTTTTHEQPATVTVH